MTVCGTRTGWGAGYLFQPGGRFGAIPTKTPVLPHQFLVSCRLSLRQSFHVLRTVLARIAFFLKILVLVWMLSVLSLVFMACSHLLCIFWGEWYFVGSLLHEIVLSHLIFHTMYIDSEMIILNNQLSPLLDLSFSFLKSVRQHPRRVL